MKFISVRDLRGRSAQIWQQLAYEQELVVTSNGKPIAILTATDEDGFEQSINELRRVRALRAIGTLQKRSMARGRDQLSSKEIDTEIGRTRRARSR